MEHCDFSASKGAILWEYRWVGHTKDGVGGEGWGNLRHRAAVRGSGLWLPAVLVTGPQTVVGQLVPRRRAENNHIKDLGYNIV